MIRRIAEGMVPGGVLILSEKLAVQDALELPTAMLLSDCRGTEKPLASNDTARGRALNRRVEVEFWYDDPLQELPDEPQLCPGDAGAEMVTRVYDPPWGTIGQISFAGGQPVIPDGYTAQLDRALADVADKTNPRLRFVGYTRNERLERRTAAVYGDDIGLSASRARRAMEQVAGDMSLESNHGWVIPENVVTNRRGGHHVSHGRRRPRHGVGAEVDHESAQSLWSNILGWRA